MFFQKKRLDHTNAPPEKTVVQNPLLENFFNLTKTAVGFQYQYYNEQRNSFTVNRVSFRRPTRIDLSPMLKKSAPDMSLYASVSRVTYDTTSPISSAVPATYLLPSVRPSTSIQFDCASRNFCFDFFKQYLVPSGSNRYGVIVTNNLPPTPHSFFPYSTSFQLYCEQHFSPTPLSPSTPRHPSPSPHRFKFRNLIGFTSYLLHLSSSLRLSLPNFQSLPLLQFLEVGYNVSLFRLGAGLTEIRYFAEAVVNYDDGENVCMENKIREDGVNCKWLLNWRRTWQLGVEFDRMWNGAYPMKVGVVVGGPVIGIGKEGSWRARVDLGRDPSLRWDIRSGEVDLGEKRGKLSVGVSGSVKVPYEAMLDRATLGLDFVLTT